MNEFWLSKEQERLWVDSVVNSTSDILCVQLAFKFIGKLDATKFIESVSVILRDTPIFNLKFQANDGRLSCYQQFSPVIGFEVVSLAQYDDMLSDEQSEIDFVEKQAQKTIDLFSQPNYRFVLYQSRQKDVYYFSGVLPHLLIDGYSTKLLFIQLAELYNGGKQAIADFSAIIAKAPTNNNVSNASELNALLNYWQQKIAQNTHHFDMGKFIKTPQVTTSKNLRLYATSQKPLAKAIRQLAKGTNTTVFTVVSSLYALVLYRYTNQTKFSMIYPVNIRDKAQNMNLGFYVNLLPIQLDFTTVTTVADLISQIKQQRKFDKQHQTFDYAEINKLLREQGKEYFNVIVSPSYLLPNFTLEGVDIDPIALNYGHSGFELALLYDGNDSDFQLYLEYQQKYMAGWLAQQLLEDVVKTILIANDNLQCPIIDYPLFVKVEGKQYLSSQKLHPTYDGFIQRFDKVANQYANKVAICNSSQSFTYQQLVKQVRCIALNLIQQGYTSQQRVVVLHQNNIEYIPLLLALISLRCTFIPLDVSLPNKRQLAILEEATPDHLIVSDICLIDTGNLLIPITRYESLLTTTTTTNNTSIQSSSGQNDIMYILYTSGSTGQPKGVPIGYDAIDHLLHISGNYFDFNVDDVWSNSHSFSFDFSIWEVLGALWHGSTLNIVPDNIRRNPIRYYQYLCAHHVNVCNITPTAFKQLVKVDAELQQRLSLRYLIFGGEKLTYGDCEDWLKRHGNRKPMLCNMYGLTEAPIHASFHQLSLQDGQLAHSNIGKPLPDFTWRVINDLGQDCPVGVYGEIYLHSRFLTKGYLNHEQLNKEKFIQLSDRNSYYLTGDHGCYLLNGELDYLGRKDQQVQIQGHRVELDEINSLLKAQTHVYDAISFVTENAEHEKSLISVCVAVTSLVKSSSLRQVLSDALPYYMIPVNIIIVDSFPLTPNGKVDVKQLQAQLNTKQDVSNDEHPETEFTEKVAMIWQDILANKQINYEQNYFDVGGDSINLLRLHAQLEKISYKKISVISLFKYTTIREQASYLNSLINDKSYVVSNAVKEAPCYINQDIAIVGMATRAPGADDVEHFWQNLIAGEESISFFSDENANSYADSTRVGAKGILQQADCFDYGFFDYSYHEASLLDPQHRVLLETSWAALENAGYVIDDDNNHVGVFVGQSNFSTYFQHCIAPTISEEDSIATRYQIMLSNSPDFLATKLAYKLNLSGPAMTIQTGCSTSLVAICRAVKSLQQDECDLAIAGGVSITFPLVSSYRYEPGMILSPDGHCRAFDEQANGTVPGNGVGVVVLKRYTDALADGDHIYAVIKGSAVNNDAHQKIGFTAPSQSGQAQVIQQALKSANISADTIDYIETHGTGTQLGDPIEVAALSQVFNDSESGYVLGALKPNIGHLDAAAGVLGLIKTTLSLYHKQFTPTINHTTRNSQLAGSEKQFNILTHAQAWQCATHPRRAGVSAFGIGGTNAHVVLEEAPSKSEITSSLNLPRILPLSAKSIQSLTAISKQLAEYLEQPQMALSLDDISHSLQLGRQAFNHRAALVVNNVPDLIEQLSVFSDENASSISKLSKPCFVFQGQGMPIISHLYSWYSQCEVLHTTIDQQVEYIKQQHDIDLSKYFDQEIDKANTHAFDGVNQLYTFIAQYAFAQQLLSYGIQPQVLLGHSLGEYIAAAIANVWSLEDSLDIIVKRQQLMNDLPAGAMLAVFASTDELLPLLTHGMSIAAINGQSRCTVSGSEPDIKQLKIRLTQRQIVFHVLSVKHAYHSSDIEIIQLEFEHFLQQYTFNAPQYPIMSNTKATCLTAHELTPTYFARHMRETVLFNQCVHQLLTEEVTHFIQLGVHDLVSPILRQTDEQAITRYSIQPFTSMQRDQGLSEHLSKLAQLWQQGIDIDWQKIPGQKIGRRIPLPTYQFQRDRVWYESESSVISDTINLYQAGWKSAKHVTSAATTSNTSYIILSDLATLDSVIVKAVMHHVQVEHALLINDEIVEGLKRTIIRHSKTTSLDIILFWPFSAVKQVSLATLSPAYEALNTYIKLLQLIAQYPEQINAIHLVTQNVFGVMQAESPSPLAHLLLGPASAFIHEYPKIAHRIIDIPSNPSQKLVAQLALDITASLDKQAYERIIAYRYDKRYLPDFMPMQVDNSQPTSVLTEGGCYLITGGLGHIGLTFAQYIAKQINAHIILLSRQSFPPEAQWSALLDEPSTSLLQKTIIKQLQLLKQNASQLSIVHADVADYKELCKAIDELQLTHHEFGGVIHCAGESDLLPIDQITPEEIEQALRVKVMGAINLDKLAKTYPFEFMLLNSGISHLTGEYGQALYNAGNAFLDAFAAWRSAHKAQTLCVNWDIWTDGGMAAKLTGKLDGVSGVTRHNVQAVLPFIFSGYVMSNIAITPQNIQQRLAHSITSRLAHYSNEHFSSQETEQPKNGDFITQLWKKYLGTTEPNSTFTELGGDSLLAVQLASMLSQHYSISIAPHVFIEHSSLASLQTYIMRTLAKDKSPEKMPFSVVTLSPIQMNRPNLFLIHPIGGTVNIYQDLAQALSQVANVYGIQAQALDGHTSPEQSLAQMAASYKTCIQTIQGSGPYWLGGASLGGLIAYEISQQLYADGETTNGLLLFDTPSPEYYPHTFPSDAAIIRYMLEVGSQHAAPENFEQLSLEQQLDYFLQHAGGLGKAIPEFNRTHLQHYLTIYKANFKAMLDYKLQPPQQKSLKINYYKALQRDAINPSHPESGWLSLLNQHCHVDIVPGTHITMMFAPNVIKISDDLARLIA